MSPSLPMDEEGRWGRALEPEAIALTDAELREAACRVDPREAAEHPEKAWTRYLRAMALIALRRWISQRKADLTVGPELEPEDPQRLLALNGRAAQLLCCSPLDESVEVPVEVWQRTETAPQLLLLAQVDEDNGLVHFPGALDGESMVAELRQKENNGQITVPVGLERFDGGLERLVRLLTLLPGEALVKAGIINVASDDQADLMKRLEAWLKALLDSPTQLTPIPVTGTRSAGGSTLRMINPFAELDEAGNYIARAACDTPTIWVDTPLAELQIWHEGTLLWRKQATSTDPIETPIHWPLKTMEKPSQFLLRLRPYGMAGGNYVELKLILPGTSVAISMPEFSGQPLLFPQIMAMEANRDLGQILEILARLQVAGTIRT